VRVRRGLELTLRGLAVHPASTTRGGAVGRGSDYAMGYGTAVWRAYSSWSCQDIPGSSAALATFWMSARARVPSVSDGVKPSLSQMASQAIAALTVHRSQPSWPSATQAWYVGVPTRRAASGGSFPKS